MIVKMKPLFICGNCGNEIGHVGYERGSHLLAKYEYSLDITFSPEKCPHCGEFIECIEYNINDFKMVK